jgi:hypothetical protein
MPIIIIYFSAFTILNSFNLLKEKKNASFFFTRNIIIQTINLITYCVTKRKPQYIILYAIIMFYLINCSNAYTLYSPYFKMTDLERESSAVVSFASLNYCLLI